MSETILAEEPLVRRIDLTRPAAVRLADAMQDQAAGTALVREALAAFPPPARLLLEPFGLAYTLLGGLHQDELEAWAGWLGCTFGEIAAVNCGYELDHLQATLTPARFFGQTIPFFCTSAVWAADTGQPLHLRNLDWPIAGLGEATRFYEFHLPKHRFVTVGFPGYAGALTGMVPGAYSLSVNWAPPEGAPDFHHGPAFLARRVLTRCNTYAKAVEELASVQLSTGAFYTVCGARRGEACVVERTARHAEIRSPEEGLVVQTNHYQAAGFQELNQEIFDDPPDELIRTTREREREARQALRALGADAAAADARATLRRAPTTNGQTVQRVALSPAARTIWLERRVSAPGQPPRWRQSRMSW